MTNNKHNKVNRELEIGEKIASNNISDLVSSKIRLEIATGNMLGDGSLVTYCEKRVPRGFALKLTSQHRQYIDHLRNIYGDWTTQKIYDKNQRRKSTVTNESLGCCWAFDTRTREELLIFQDWRCTSSERLEELQKRDVTKKRKSIKVLGSNLDELLTERALAYWYMDDGHLDKMGKHIVLSTNDFTREETNRLVKLLSQKFNIKARESPAKSKVAEWPDQWRIYIANTESQKFVDVVKPYIIPCFNYKLDI